MKFLNSLKTNSMKKIQLFEGNERAMLFLGILIGMALSALAISFLSKFIN